jgi:hypothetical protein
VRKSRLLLPNVAKGKEPCQFFEVLGCVVVGGVGLCFFFCFGWVSWVRGGVSLWVLFLGFCGSLFSVCPFSQCFLCTLPVYLRAHLAFNKI